MTGLNKLKTWLLTNWPIKLTALVLATVLWAVVAAREQTTESVRVTLTVQTPEGRMLTTDLPEIQAWYSGTFGELAKLLQDPPTINHVMPDTLSGSSYLLTLSTADLITARDADVVPERVYPDTITVELDDVMERRIVVTHRVRITPDSGYGLIGDIVVSPTHVMVRGTEEQLNNISTIRTVSRDTSRVRGPVSFTVALDTSGLGGGIRVGASEVQVSADVGELQRQFLMGVVVSVPGGWESDPPVVNVTVIGPTERILGFTRDSVTVVAQPNESEPESRVRLTVRAPRGVTATVRPDSVLVRRRSSG